MKGRLLAACLVAGGLLTAALEPAGLDLLYRARDIQAGYGVAVPAADARIRLLVIDQKSPGQLGKPFGLWAPELTEVLTALAKAKPAVVGIDVALNPYQGQGETELATALRALPVVLAEQTGLPDGGLPMLGGDPTVRQSSASLTSAARAVADDQLSADGAVPPATSFVGKVAEMLTGQAPAVTGLINYGASLPADDFSDVLTRLRGGNPLFEYKGAACLIVADGWTYRNLLPTPCGPMSTGDIQGLALNTLLMGNPVRSVPLALAMLVTAALTAAAAFWRWRWVLPVAAFYGLGAVELFAFAGWWLPVVAPAAGIVVGRALRAWARRPARVKGKSEWQALLVTRLGAFTAGSPEQTMALLEDYVEDMEGIAARHGGVQVRLAGDELLVLLPSANAAVQAGLAMFSHVEGMAEFAGLRMGLHCGTVVTGDVSGRRAVLGDDLAVALRTGREEGPRFTVTPAAREAVSLAEVRWEAAGDHFVVSLPGDEPPLPPPAPVLLPALAPEGPERTLFGSVRTHIAGPAEEQAQEVALETPAIEVTEQAAERPSERLADESLTTAPVANPGDPSPAPVHETPPVQRVDTDEPSAAEATAEAPPAMAAATQEPADEEAAAAAVEEPAPDDEPAPEEPAAQETADEEPPADSEPPAQDAADEEPAAEQPSDEQPAGEQPADEQPSDEQPSDEQLSDEQPADEQPAGEQPADEQPAGELSAAEGASPGGGRWVWAGRPYRWTTEEGYWSSLPALCRPTEKAQEPAAAWLERGDRAPDIKIEIVI